MRDTFSRAQTFMHRNARPLDIARWQYHFEGGSQQNVISALTYYQNPDGGFGHAIEADSWNPNSSPIQTWTATEVLREVNFSDANSPIICGILRYLDGRTDFTGHFWLNTVISNNDYPHAPWWHTDTESTCHHDYNPTACLAGFIIRYADEDSELYALGSQIAQEAFDSYMSGKLLSDMHTAACFIRLLQYCEESGRALPFDADALRDKLRRQVTFSITRDKSKWENSYICRPSQFLNSPNDAFFPGNEDICAYECEYIIRAQLADGSWNIPWGWGGYPEEWALSKNWWKCDGIIKNLLYLKGFSNI